MELERRETEMDIDETRFITLLLYVDCPIWLFNVPRFDAPIHGTSV